MGALQVAARPIRGQLDTLVRISATRDRAMTPIRPSFPSPTSGWALLILSLAGCAGGSDSSTEGAARTEGTSSSGELSWNLPADVPPSNGLWTQRDFEEFAWRSFVSLSWPANPDGSPDSTTTIGADGDAPTVWESYMEVSGVFLPGGAPPMPWGESAPLPQACQGLGDDGLPVMQMTSKVADVVSAFVEPFASPVVDQDSSWVRYAIQINRDAYDYIVADTLYRRDVQLRRVARVDYPSGQYGTDTVGAISIKSAWKLMSADDDASRFHRMQAYVYTPVSEDPPIRTASCTLQTLGLVGLHIAHKTSTHPQWIWATFEQVDNVQVPEGANRRPSFSDPDCDCPDEVNQPPARPWDPSRPGVPTQVERVTAIPSGTRQVNADWQGRLAGVSSSSPWQYYELVGAQRPRTPSDPLGLGSPEPQFLANTVIETYDQGDFGRSSSCMGCHFNAVIPGDSATGSKFSDYSYILMMAQEPGGS
jgi:hypothetical protein